MDVKDLLVEKNIEFKSRGKDYVVRCLSPDHEDIHPSLKIDKISGIFQCWSCGFSGDIFSYFNINKKKFIDIKVQEVIEKIRKLIATKSQTIPLDAVPFTSDYRNIKGTTFKHFKAFISDSLMEGRIIFPIYDINDNLVVFQGRYIYSDLDPKYKNDPPDTPFPLYPAIVKPIKGSIILVEGLFDAINLYDKGLTNVVCTFGTVFGTVKKDEKRRKNIDRLLPYKYQGVDTVYIMFDGDDPGKKAATNLKEYISSIFFTETIDLPEHLDPGKLSQEQINKLRIQLYD